MLGRFSYYCTIVVLASRACAQTCYYEDGSVDPFGARCTSNDGTFCCASKSICMSNGVYIAVDHQPYIFYVRSCTDQKWGPGCSSLCAGKNPSSGAIISCVGDNDHGDPVYCCGYQTNSSTTLCSDGEVPFTIGPGHMVFGRAALSAMTETSSTSAPATPTSNTTNPTTTTTPTKSSEPDTYTPECSSKVTAVGAGIGIPLGVIALAALVWALMERNARRRTMHTSMAPVPAPTGQDIKYTYTPPSRPPVELDEYPRHIREMVGSPVSSQGFSQGAPTEN